MNEKTKWRPYLCVSLLFFCQFLLEYLSILAEALLLRFDVSNYTPLQRSAHHLIMALLWCAVTAALLGYSRGRLRFPVKRERKKLPWKDWAAAVFCLALCKVLTLIDWRTLKVIGEFQGKPLFEFCTQYLYYVVEVLLVLFLIVFGQKALETRLGKETRIPFGGLVAAFTWGAFHFVSRGVGLEVWNGISCMIFSMLAGVMYLKLDRKLLLSYLFIALGYLL